MTRLAALVTASLQVAATRSRKKKQSYLSALLRSLAPDEVAIAVSYLSGVMPQGRIGLGWAAIRDLDPGPPPAEATLSLLEVDRRLEDIKAVSGKGSKTRRTDALGALFAKASAEERTFLRHLIIGEVRQGALASVMLEAVAEATGIEAAVVRRAAMLAGSVADVATAALLEGEAGLGRFALTLFVPVMPMLASPAEDISAALDRLSEAYFERKLDGARVQVHKDGDEVRVYSRKLHEVTARVPEIVEAVRRSPARSLILDGEAIALHEDGSPHTFQTTMRRFGRKLGLSEARAALPLSHFYFDLLQLDGQTLLDQPARERTAALDSAVASSHRLARIQTDDVAEAERFFEQTIRAGHEGLMAKSLDAPYAAGSRGFSWLKLKPVHTLDLVVLAVEEGSGRRRGWLSNLHLGARDPSDGSFVMLGKTFKGMTDEILAWQTEALGKLAIGREGHVVHVRPELVVEIAFSDVQESPHYPGGMALRFARLKRYRPDKAASDADTVDEVRRILEHGHRRPV